MTVSEKGPHVALASGRNATRLAAGDERLPAVLALIQQSFAYMDARIEPPSSMHALDLAALNRHCAAGEIWCVGEAPDACVLFTPRADCLYLGKLAVAEACRGQGLARELVALARQRARHHGFAAIELEVRIELVENQAAFGRLGFVQVGTSCHAGYDRPTSVTMRKAVLDRET